MDCQLGLESLPVEVLGHIASYLNVQDILSCCATSSFLREAFNDDLVWKRNCDLELVNYLKSSVCFVEPSFEWDEYEQSSISSSLPSVSSWRKSYMMQVRLFDNWRHGRFEKEQIEFGPQNVVFDGTKAAFYDGDYLFLHSTIINQNRMLDEIWDIRESPFLHSTLDLNFNRLSHDYTDILAINIHKIVENKLVISQYNLVLVYDISVSSFSRPPLAHMFLFDKSEEFSRETIKSDQHSLKHNAFLNGFEPMRNVETMVCCNFFIGIVTSLTHLSHPVLHIWDIQTGRKMKEATVQTTNVIVAGIHLLSSKNETNLIIKLSVNKDRFMYFYQGYDLTKMEFSSFSVKLNYCDFLILAGKHVVGVGPQTVYVYNYLTSEKMLVRKCNHEILKKTLTVVGNDLLYGTFENIIHVMNLTTLDIINSVKLGFTLYSLQAICDRFVVINSTNSEVWEVKKNAKKLFKLPNDGSFVSTNKYCTKLAIERENKLTILNFW